MIVLHIDEPIPSLNKTIGGHWSRQLKHRRRWRWLTRAALHQAKFFEQPKWPRAKIRIERYGERILDADNVRCGAKALIDALKLEGVIEDDSMAHIGEPEIRQFIVPRKQRGETRVYVTPVQS